IVRALAPSVPVGKHMGIVWARSVAVVTVINQLPLAPGCRIADKALRLLSFRAGGVIGDLASRVIAVLCLSRSFLPFPSRREKCQRPPAAAGASIRHRGVGGWKKGDRRGDR